MFGDWLSLCYVPPVSEEYVALRTDDHRTQRAGFERDLAAARSGVPVFSLLSGEELQDDEHRYLVWRPAPHWNRRLLADQIGTSSALGVRAWVQDALGRKWMGSEPTA